MRSHLFLAFLSMIIAMIVLPVSGFANDFYHTWKNKEKAIVLDAYERNDLDWLKIVKNKQIRGFIGKASDGLPSPYSCSGNSTQRIICKKSFQNYFMKQQLYHTRKTLAKNLGLKWGAYHLGRPGNPIQQANHFIKFADPQEDELIAIDIEHDDPKKWISFKDAEIFAKHIHFRLGRYPVLYTNHDTAKKIAARRAEFPILSRLPLWYARFKGDVRGVFPLGHWKSYNLWQFSAGPNCNKRRCLYRVKGAPTNIDVNVSTLTIEEFDKAWPFNGLVPEAPISVDQPLMVNATKPEKKIETINIADIRKQFPEAKVITASLLKELGVENLAVPSRSPIKNDEVQTVMNKGDGMNLNVRIIKRSMASNAKKAYVTHFPGEAHIAALAE